MLHQQVRNELLLKQFHAENHILVLYYLAGKE